MRLSPSILLAGAASLLATPALAKPKVPKPTVFNGITVQPLFELTPANYEEEIKKTKYTLVKHYRYRPLATVNVPMRFSRHAAKASDC
jgi:protein disulfide-isomerase